MATTINGLTGRNSSYWRYYLICTEQNVDVASNTSKLKVEVYLGATSYSRAVRGNVSATHTVNVNGTNYTFTTGAYTIEKNETIKLGEITSNTIQHNTDGTKVVAVSVSSPDLAQASGYGPYSGSASGNVGLSTIPRASSFTTSGNAIGSAINVSISRASNSFTHAVTLRFGSISETKTGVATSTSFTPNLSNYGSQIPNSMSGTGTIVVDTYNGTTKIGSSSKSITLNLPTGTKPSVPSISLQETVGGLASKFGAYIQNKSKIKVTTSANGIYGSSISSYKIEINGSVYNSSSCTTNVLYTTGDNICKVTVIDSRGQTNTNSTTFNVLSYQEPKISKFTAERNQTNSTIVNCILSVSITPLNNKNDHSIKLDLNSTNKYSNTSDYSISDNTQNITGVEQTQSYTLTLTVSDYFTTVKQTINIGTDFALMNFASDGRHMAIGQIYDSTKGGVLQVNGDILGNLKGNSDTATKSTNSDIATTANRVNSRGVVSPENGGTQISVSGISMSQAYNNSYPDSFGNILNLKGAGSSQVFLGWKGNSTIGKIAYRSLRDYTGDGTVWSSWGEIFTAKTLYDNSSGTNGTITLNETAANFTYLEIQYVTDINADWYMHRIKAGKDISTTLFYAEAPTTESNMTNNFWLFTRRIYTNGTTLGTYKDGYGLVNISGNTGLRSNRFKITKVIGYR